LPWKRLAQGSKPAADECKLGLAAGTVVAAAYAAGFSGRLGI